MRCVVCCVDCGDAHPGMRRVDLVEIITIRIEPLFLATLVRISCVTVRGRWFGVWWRSKMLRGVPRCDVLRWVECTLAVCLRVEDKNTFGKAEGLEVLQIMPPHFSTAEVEICEWES